MKHCEAIALEPVGPGYLFKGTAWPDEIFVERSLLEYPQGPHVQFGRKGTLAFACVNGSATYRRFEDMAGGWRYKLVDCRLSGISDSAKQTAASPQIAAPISAEKKYRHHTTGQVIEAFQWLPHAAPPAVLPDWFMRADFEHNKEGALTVRSRAGVVRAQPGDWLTFDGQSIGKLAPAIFAQNYQAADEHVCAA